MDAVRTLLEVDPPAEVVPQPSAPPDPATVETLPAPPPAARIVVEGQRSEREINLETELQAERDRHAVTASEKKEREIKISFLQDKLDQIQRPDPAAPKKAPWFPTILDDE